eukprot:2726023-Pleurochrysis_carterae.AAC.8
MHAYDHLFLDVVTVSHPQPHIQYSALCVTIHCDEFVVLATAKRELTLRGCTAMWAVVQLPRFSRLYVEDRDSCIQPDEIGERSKQANQIACVFKEACAAWYSQPDAS